MTMENGACSPPHHSNISVAQSVTESLLGNIAWISDHEGLLKCPGEDLHTTPTKESDCLVMLSGAPTIFCFHSSCEADVQKANYSLRISLGKCQAGREPFSPKRCLIKRSSNRRKQAEDKTKKLTDCLKERAKKSLPLILEEWASGAVDLFEESPVRLLEDPKDDWRLLLRLFDPRDIVWIGSLYDSGTGCERKFRPVCEWLLESSAPNEFTCPNSFREGACSRSNENIAAHRFLVVESDYLSKNEISAVFVWLRQCLRLRAVIDTAGRSLHGWFDYPSDPKIVEELKTILPPLGCDPKMFRLSQPCRLPGKIREDKKTDSVWSVEPRQSLIWLDLGGNQ